MREKAVSDIVFNIGAYSAASLTRIGRITGVMFSVKGIGVKVDIVRIGRFEFGFLETNDRGV